MQRKAVVLLSGGLDSMLAAKLLLDQGVHVEAINFYTGFCHSGHTSAIRNNKKANKPKRNDALWSAEQLGIQLHIIDIVDEYKKILIAPRHGYGQHINPCLDCKIFMVGKAQQWMQENGFDFIATGEVIGQRPKSQRKETMPVIANESHADDLLLRPLCAKLLPPTFPEREGWVDREKLKDFSGRSRKPQIALAQTYGFEEYAQPSGGCCVLTDESYARKLRDMWQTRGKRDYDFDDIVLLKIGRHLRPKPHFKMIIGREEGENNFLSGYRNQFNYLHVKSHTGPLVLIDGELSEQDWQLAAEITARFSSGRDADEVTIERVTQQEKTNFIVKPMGASSVLQEWYV